MKRAVKHLSFTLVRWHQVRLLSRGQQDGFSFRVRHRQESPVRGLGTLQVRLVVMETGK